MYLKWNEHLNQYFLKESNEGHPVYLDPDPGLFDFLESRFRLDKGRGRGEFLDVVRAVLEDPESRENLFDRVDNAVIRWRVDARRRQGAAELEERAFPPPVTALLTATVLAAQQMDESSATGKYISSTNYYAHLEQVLGIDPTHKEKLRRDFTVTEDFWEDFSWWLDEVDGRFGMPSARATSHRYVGLPMSQSLVRFADRRALRRMFHLFGLPPGAAISPAEMAEVVGEWITTLGSGASKELVAKWQVAEARERIIDVALSELAAWDGTVEQSGRETSTAVRGAHRERVLLALLTRGRSGGVEITDMGFAMRRSNETETWSIQHEAGAEELRPRPISSTNSFVAGYELGVEPNDILQREIVLRSESGHELKREPRRIVVLAEDEAAGAYIEVRRAVSGARHRILVSPDTPDEVVDELRRLLEMTAFSGRKDLEVEGVPEDWLVIDGFVPGQVPADFQVSDELTALLASVTTQIHVRGGIRLPGRVKRWHSDATPRIVVTIGAEGGKYDLRIKDLSTQSGSQVLREQISRPEIVELPDDVRDGDHRIELVSSRGAVVHTEVLRLRSGSTKYYEGWRKREGLGHDERPITAVRALPHREDPVIEGAIVRARRTFIESGEVPPAVDWARRHVRQRTSRTGLSLPVPTSTSCLVTGSHNFLFPTFKGGKVNGSWMTGVCIHCGAVRRTPTRHWNALKPEEREASLRRRGRAVPEPAVVVASGEDVEVPAEPLPEVVEDLIPPCVVDDALAHLGSGDAAMLLALTSQVPDLTEDHDQFLRDLAALGTVETSRDEYFRRDRWETSSPALVTLSDGRLGLTGAWSLKQHLGLEAVVEELGGEVHDAVTGSELTTVTGVDVADAFEYEELDGVVDAAFAAQEIAAHLPDLSAVAEELPRKSTTMVAGPWQMYLVRELAWVDVAGWDAPGLYRRNRGYRRDYWFRTAEDVKDGTGAPVDVDLGKHLLGLLAGEPLLGYDPESQELTVPLGARLPGLYERAAVLCSGRVPEKDLATFSMTYIGVPPAIAATLHARMTS